MAKEVALPKNERQKKQRTRTWSGWIVPLDRVDFCGFMCMIESILFLLSHFSLMHFAARFPRYYLLWYFRFRYGSTEYSICARLSRSRQIFLGFRDSSSLLVDYGQLWWSWPSSLQSCLNEFLRLHKNMERTRDQTRATTTHVDTPGQTELPKRRVYKERRATDKNRHQSNVRSIGGGPWGSYYSDSNRVVDAWWG